MDQAAVMAIVMLATAWMTIAFALALWRRRDLVGARSLAAASASVALWAGLYAGELLAPSLDAAVTWGDLKYIGVCLLVPSWVVFGLHYTGRGHWDTRELRLALAIHPLLMMGLLTVPATHDLVRGAEIEVTATGIPVVSVGPLFWGHLAYVALAMGSATVLIGRTLMSTRRRYRTPSLMLLVAVLLPPATNLAFVLPPIATPVDLTPVAFAFAIGAFLWGVLRFRLFNIAPAAREDVFDALDDAVVVVDPYRRVVELNAAAEALFAMTKREAAGLALSDLLGDHALLIEDVEGVVRREIALPRGDGVVDFEARVSPIRSGSAVLPGHVLVFRDISERRRAQRQLEQMVYYDLLTGLPNRLLYRDRLEQALALARRGGHAVAVLFLDLDGFKEVNDTLGHGAGDMVLRESADRLRRSLRESDTAARLGGDEFIIVLPSVDDQASALAVGEKLRDALGEPLTIDGHTVHVTASVGVAVAPPHSLDSETLGMLADAAMYTAKAGGKNRVCLAPAGAPEVLTSPAEEATDVLVIEHRRPATADPPVEAPADSGHA